MTVSPTTSPIDLSPSRASDLSKYGPGGIRDAARQFEALLIGQIMRTMRETFAGGLASGEDQTGASMSEFAEQQMAQVLSTSGGFGLASLIEQGLSRGVEPLARKDDGSSAPKH